MLTQICDGELDVIHRSPRALLMPKEISVGLTLDIGADMEIDTERSLLLCQ